MAQCYLLWMDVRGIIREVLKEGARYVADTSEEALERELYDAQGEMQQFLGPDDAEDNLFGDPRSPVDMALSDLVTASRLDDIRLLIQKQGKYGRNTVNKFKRMMIAGKPIPPVVAWKDGPGRQHLISGRHRILAAYEIGVTHVPTIMMYWRDREDELDESSEGRSYRWIYFSVAKDTGKTRIYDVFAKEGSILLGKVKWFPSWRKYSFFPEAGTVFEQDCLNDIASFLEELMMLRKRS